MRSPHSLRAAILPLLAAVLVTGGCQQLELLRLYHANDRTQARLNGELPLRLPFRDVDGWVIVEGSVDGKAPIPWVIDSGAPVIVLIDAPDTAHLELDMRGARRLGSADNLAAPTAAPQSGRTLSFGGLDLPAQTVLGMPIDSLACRGPTPEVPFRGVIGYDLLRRYVLEIDYDTTTLSLHDPATYVAASDAIEVPFELIRRQPYVTATVNPVDAPPYAAKLHVDSGSSVALTLFPSTSDAITAPAEGRETEACFAGGGARYRHGAEIGLALADRHASRVAAAYAIGGLVKEQGQNGRLGARYLRNYTVTFDYPRERLLLAPRRAPATDRSADAEPVRSRTLDEQDALSSSANQGHVPAAPRPTDRGSPMPPLSAPPR